MTRSVYVATVEPFTGKSAIALGILELLSRRVERVGVFRPIVRSEASAGERDYVLDLLVSHEAVTLTYDECAGVSYEQVHADPGAAMDEILDRYHRVADQCDVVVVVGSDYTDVVAPAEFAFNARVAANLGAPVVLVLNGFDRSVDQLHTAADLTVAELHAHHASLSAIVVNRVRGVPLEDCVEALSHEGVPAYALPEQTLLHEPSVASLMAACDGRLIGGDPEQLHREVSGLVVAAMTLPNVLDRLFEGALVVTPGDRPEIVLGVLNAHASANFPQVAGIVLNGGLELAPQVQRLLEGLSVTLPIVATDLGTHAASAVLTDRRGRLDKNSPRKIATALSLFAEHVDGTELLDLLEVAHASAVTPLMFEHQLLDTAMADPQHIVLPEGSDDRILRAADTLLRRNIVNLTILGDPREVQARTAALGVDLSAARILDPQDPDDPEIAEMRERFAVEYQRQRAHKGIDLERAREVIIDSAYFGTMMVELGLADGMVSGAAHTTAHTIRPALEFVRTVPGVSVVSSVFFMCLSNQVLVYGDCAIIPDPTAEQLADIALASAATAAAFGVEPRVAMLSYSTGSSGSGLDVEKVTQATALVRERAPDLLVEGPIQYDAAIDPGVAQKKLPDSEVAGRATVLIFPDLNTGNNTYKAVQRSAGALAIGPVLQGLRKPVNDLSRGATVRDILNTVAITAIQAQRGSS
ncbi:phosphate acetyltransferase [Nocardioides salsibiostraticola]